MEDLIQAFGINWKLLLMQLINFGLLLFVLHRFLYKPMLAMLEKRRKIVEVGVKNARKAESKLESAEEEKNQIISKSNQKAGEIIDRAKKRGEESGKEIIGEAQGRATTIERDAELRAQEAQARIINETKDKIAQTAILAAKKIMEEKL